MSRRLGISWFPASSTEYNRAASRHQARPFHPVPQRAAVLSLRASRRRRPVPRFASGHWKPGVQAFQGAGTPKPFDFISHAKPEAYRRASITSNGAQADALILWIEDCSQADLRSREEAETASLKAYAVSPGAWRTRSETPSFPSSRNTNSRRKRSRASPGRGRGDQQGRPACRPDGGLWLKTETATHEVSGAQLIEEAFAAQKPS